MIFFPRYLMKITRKVEGNDYFQSRNRKKKKEGGGEKKESYQYSRAIKRIAEQRKSSGDRRLERG